MVKCHADQRARVQDDRRRKVLSLMVRGHTVAGIAHRVGCSRATVDLDIAAIKVAEDPATAEVRSEIERAAWRVVESATDAKDHHAVTGALRLIGRIRGVDKGDALNINVDAGPLEVRFVEPGSGDE